MAKLNDASVRAIERLRNYSPPPTRFYEIPSAKRSAVLILLFADLDGHLKVVLTLRSKSLSSFAGHAVLPGGKSDGPLETPFETARREAFEEIGLPQKDNALPYLYSIEYLCELPANLSTTELGIRPCVAFLRSATGSVRGSFLRSPLEHPNLSIEKLSIWKPEADEVTAVFTAPLENFLSSSEDHASAKDDKGEWYQARWTSWQETRWRMHQFFVPVNPDLVVRPQNQHHPQTATKLSPAGHASANVDLPARFKVFGTTARLLVDCARIAYGREPDFEINSHFGDEEIIARLVAAGRFDGNEEPGKDLPSDVTRGESSKI